MNRVMIFIDGSNFYGGLQEFIGKGTKIDFGKFVELVRDDRQLIRTYYYSAAIDRDEDKEGAIKQQKFFDSLTYIPYFEVKLGYLRRRGTGHVEKGVDTKLAADMIKHAYRNSYDVAILVSGDGDFAYIAGAVKETGKHVEVVYFERANLEKLRKSADRTILLSKDRLKSCILP